jgi:hypothetical protein
MSLVFPYKLLPTQKPVPSLDGRMTRPRPLVTITLIGPSGIYVRNGLVDPGSDDTVFSQDAANVIGIDLTHAPAGAAAGIGTNVVPVRYAKAVLRLTDGHEFREWPAWIGFTPVALRQPLLGFSGFLQFFAAIFDGAAEQLQLTVNNIYPGS